MTETDMLEQLRNGNARVIDAFHDGCGGMTVTLEHLGEVYHGKLDRLDHTFNLEVILQVVLKVQHLSPRRAWDTSLLLAFLCGRDREDYARNGDFFEGDLWRCAAWILEQYPQLKTVHMPDTNDEDVLHRWLSAQLAFFGDTLDLFPLSCRTLPYFRERFHLDD